MEISATDDYLKPDLLSDRDPIRIQSSLIVSFRLNLPYGS